MLDGGTLMVTLRDFSILRGRKKVTSSDLSHQRHQRAFLQAWLSFAIWIWDAGRWWSAVTACVLNRCTGLARMDSNTDFQNFLLSCDYSLRCMDYSKEHMGHFHACLSWPACMAGGNGKQKVRPLVQTCLGDMQRCQYVYECLMAHLLLWGTASEICCKCFDDIATTASLVCLILAQFSCSHCPERN